MKDHFDRQYREDERMGMLSSVFTALAIILAVLGLYGLVLVTLLKKTKEIGVRKVLGADLISLLRFFGGYFMALVGIAVLIGMPVSYLVIQDFLQQYSYSRGVEWSVLLMASFLLVALCGITILFQTRRISGNNPVDSLRYE